MKMRPLIIGPAEIARIEKVAAWAKDHPYRPYPGCRAPGDDDRHVAKLGTYRAVFTITHAGNGAVLRQLSVSVPGKKYPHPAACFMIAHHFGFTGWSEATAAEPGKDWIVGPHQREHCVVVAQELKQ